MWQPIETAPRDQTFLAVLNCAGEQTICTMRWPVAEAKNSRPDNKTFHVERVTHWMPLPKLPGAQLAPSVPEGFSREDLEAVADGLDGYEKTVNVGNVTGGGDDHLESTTAYAARFIRTMLAAAPEAKPCP